jgi:GDP-mannose 6-dehydrogenase
LRIAVFGLGYVGCVSAACFARAGHTVIGVDVNPVKLDIINSGKSPIVEPGLEEYISEAVAAGRLKAIGDFKEAVANTDISLICVGTPSKRNGSLNLDYIFRVAEQIGEAVKEISHFHVAVIRSTVLPGTLHKLVDIIAEKSGKVAGEDFGACSNPEFLREGTALKDFYDPPYTVIGQYNEKSGAHLEQIYSMLDAPMIRTDVRVAEMVKYANNVFHALKVAFANEIGSICKQENVDGHKLMDIFVMDHKLNLSSYYLKPGFAFGGSCLPKDVRGLSYRARELDVDVPVISSLMRSNELHVQRAIDMVVGHGKRKVGVLGLSFKGGTDDLRESPMVDVVETLIGKGFDLKIYDRNVNLAKLFGANKEYINDKIPHISSIMVESAEQVQDHAEVIIIGNKSDEFAEALRHTRPDQIIIDYVRILKEYNDVPAKCDGIAW